MKTKSVIIFALAAVTLILGTDAAQATSTIASNFRNTYPGACQEILDATTSGQNCSLCHGGGFSLNDYGSDLADANRNFAAIENMDSDGDGRTNLQEITNDCTMPGDMSSPAEADTWGTIKALFR